MPPRPRRRCWAALAIGALALVPLASAGTHSFQTQQQGTDDAIISSARHLQLAPHCKHRFYLPVGFGGLNNEKWSIWGAVKLANATGRTLLLPLLLEKPFRMSPRPTYVPFGDVFDPSAFCEALAREGVCIACSQYLEEFVPKEAYNDTGMRTLSGEQHEDMVTVATAVVAEYDWRKVCDWKISNIQMKDCLNMHHRFVVGTAAFADRGVDVISEEKVYFLKNAFQPNDVVARAISKIRRKLAGQPYIALHMRIEEDWRAFRGRNNEFVNVSTLVSILNSSSEVVPLKTTPIYLATADPETCIAALRGIETDLVIWRDAVLNETFNYITAAFIDEQVCKYGEFMISEIWSSFGVNLSVERSAVYAVSHSTAPILGKTYAYGYQRGKSEAADSVCADKKLLRVGWKELRDSAGIQFKRVRQLCDESEKHFAQALFAE